VPDGIEVHVLPSGSSAPTLSVRYRDTGRVSERIDAAFHATVDYLDHLSG
jgi:hypothetical protein